MGRNRNRGRNRKPGKRYPSGQVKHAPPPGPTPELLAKRAAIGGDGKANNQHYGTLIGCWLEQGLLDRAEFDAGMRLVSLVVVHDRMIELPHPPRAIDPNALHGRALIEEDEERYERVMQAMESARAVLLRRDAGGVIWRATLDAARNIVTPCGGDTLARAGLKALAEYQEQARKAA